MYLVIHPSDIYYVTGVRPDTVGEILLIIQVQSTKYKVPNKGIVLCDPRTAGLFDAKKFEIIAERKQWGNVFKKCKTLATDPDVLTQTLREKLEKFGVKLIMKKSPITEQRQIKTSKEVALLRTSQQLNFQVYNKILPHLVPGVTEEEIARKIRILQLEFGASSAAFLLVVAFGPNTAVPHHTPTQRILQAGDVVLLDIGLIYRGYCSDMTRCLKLEKKEERRKKKEENREQETENTKDFQKVYGLLQKVTNEIIQGIKPGVKVANLDKQARKMLGRNAKYFTHSLGHGVGIDVHESPRISFKSKEILREGMVITIEPGLYFPGKFGARYEEMVYVTKDGSEVC